MPHRWPLAHMASQVCQRAISPGELVESHLKQIESRNPHLNAFVVVMAEQARAEARQREDELARGTPAGRLHGVPVTVKDSFDVAGQLTEVGSRLRAGNRASRDAVTVARLRAEGAIILGKTNTPELLASYETDNFVTGRTNHPLDADRTPGGSSGGEAAAIAAYCSPGGIASDGGGSIRIPAHFCGIAGLKPTPGRISSTGHYPSFGYPAGLTGVVGPMARTVGDLRLLFEVLAGFDSQDPFSVPAPAPIPAPPPRIGVWEQFYDVPVMPEIRAAVARATGGLQQAGFTVEPFAPQGLERAPNIWAFLFSQWPSAVIRKLALGHEAELHWTLRESLGQSAPSGEEVILQLAARDRMRAALLRQMEGWPILLMPVAGIPAFRHHERRWTIDGREVGLFQATMPAVVANALGLPAVAVPTGAFENGLPAGVQLMGRPFEDERVLDVAAILEKTLS